MRYRAGKHDERRRVGSWPRLSAMLDANCVRPKGDTNVGRCCGAPRFYHEARERRGFEDGARIDGCGHLGAQKSESCHSAVKSIRVDWVLVQLCVAPYSHNKVPPQRPGRAELLPNGSQAPVERALHKRALPRCKRAQVICYFSGVAVGEEGGVVRVTRRR
jgi:hypothetical protein